MRAIAIVGLIIIGGVMLGMFIWLVLSQPKVEEKKRKDSDEQ